MANKIVRNQLDKLKVHCNMCKNVVEAYVEVEKKKQELDQLYQSNVEEMKMQNKQFLAGEKEKLEQERLKMMKELDEKEQRSLMAIRSQQEELEQEKKHFQQEKASRYKLEFSNKPIHLNVGGSIMTVALSYFMD